MQELTISLHYPSHLRVSWLTSAEVYQNKGPEVAADVKMQSYSWKTTLLLTEYMVSEMGLKGFKLKQLVEI